MNPAIHRILIVGAGSIGERHLRCFLATERVVAGVVEINAELAVSIRNRYPGAAVFASLSEAFQEQWDAAVIATPAPLHIPQALELLHKNVHLLIEKPLSHDLAGVDELCRAAAASNATIGIAYVHRANPVLNDMRSELHSGRFGRPVQLVVTTGHHFPTARPAYAEIYYARRELGGGAVQDALTHVINIGEFLVGNVLQVVADIEHQVLPRVTVEDTANVLARHGHVLASYSLNQYQAPTEVTVTVICEQGTLRFEAHHNRWRWMQSPDSGWIDSEPVEMRRDDLFTLQAHAFLDAIKGKAKPLCSLQEGVNTLKVNMAVLASAETRSWKMVEQGTD